MRKILALTNVYGRPWDRTNGLYNQIILTGLSKQNDITVLVPVSIVEAFKNFKAVASVLISPLRTEPKVIYFVYLHIPKFSQWINAIFLALSVIVQCPKKILFERWDVFYSSWLYPDAVMMGTFAKLRGIPFIGHTIGSDVNIFAQKKPLQIQIRYALKDCSAIVSVSKDLSNKLNAIGLPKRILKTIYNGVDGDRFCRGDLLNARASLGLPRQGTFILFVGRMVLTKGVSELLESFNSLCNSQPDLRLIFVGDGPDKLPLEARAKVLGIDKLVTFSGTIQSQDLPNWYQCANLFCLPSYSEGIPNVILEAMACGLPVVATNVGGIPEILSQEAGLLVDAKNTDQLTASLAEALLRKWDLNVIRSLATQYSWKDTIDQFQTLVNNSSKPSYES